MREQASPDDLVLNHLRQLSEKQLQEEVLVPLLKRIGRHAQCLCGPGERGKDFVYVTTDAYGDSVLEVCQVKNSPFSGKTASSAHTMRVLTQIQTARRTAVMNPETGKKQLPQVVSLWTTHPLPDRDTADAKVFLEQLEAERCKIIGPEKIPSLLNTHLPELFDRIAFPGEGIMQAYLQYLDTHHEAPAFNVDQRHFLSAFFVDVGMTQLTQPSHEIVSLGRDDRIEHPFVPERLAQQVECFESVLSDKARFAPILSMKRPEKQPPGKEPGLFMQDVRAGEWEAAVQERIDRLSAASTGESSLRALTLLVRAAEFLSYLPETFSRDRARNVDDRSNILSAANKIQDALAKRRMRLPEVQVDSLRRLGEDLCIVADAGSGKTSLTRMLVLRAIGAGTKCVYFPCFRIRDSDQRLESAIREFLRSLSPERKRESAAKYIAEAGTIVLDGCDEAASFTTTLGDEIRTLAFRGPVSVRSTRKILRDISVPNDLADKITADGKRTRLTVEQPIRRLDFSRLEAACGSPAAHLRLKRRSELCGTNTGSIRNR
jgi:hypothetical protein